MIAFRSGPNVDVTMNVIWKWNDAQAARLGEISRPEPEGGF
jgi:hypothetical protein